MFQQIALLGRIGNDIELRYTPSGKAVANLSLAVSRTWTQDGQKKEKTIWFRVAVWDAQAENCAKYLGKGSTILVIGELEEPRTYTDKQGETRVSLEVTARNVKFIESKNVQPVGNVTIEDAVEMPF